MTRVRTGFFQCFRGAFGPRIILRERCGNLYENVVPTPELMRILTQTNVALPMSDWAVLSSNTYDGTGSRVVTNAFDLPEPQRYFRIIQP
jgi:hypothetical protein